jgi:hypothetical protein
MTELRRRAYLEAMGLDVWALKPPPPKPGQLVIQPGSGDTLLLCQQPEETAGRLAGDIARALAQGGVWAWPDQGGYSESTSLEQAIACHLFTRVVVFGEGLAREIFKADVPPVIGSASILVVDTMDEITVRGSAKQALWKHLSGSSLN